MMTIGATARGEWTSLSVAAASAFQTGAVMAAEAMAAAKALEVQKICHWFEAWSLSGKTVSPSLLDKIKADLARRYAPDMLQLSPFQEHRL